MVSVEKGKLYLVTGGSGFLGKELIKNLIFKGARVRTVARNEGKLIELKQVFPEVEIFTGDLTNRSVCAQVLKGTSGVFHLAAFKHVGMAEDQPKECVQSNVVATLNLLEEVREDKEVKFFVGISTDKAAQVSGVYGATKYLMERLIQQFESFDKGTEYRVVRYGNVLYSTGSVLCKWRDLLKEGKEVVVTDPEATRFFWTIEDAVKLIFDCMTEAEDSKPYVPEMKAMKIGNLLSAMADLYLPEDKGLRVKVIGLQPGENLHEKILEEGPTSDEVEEYTVDEIKELI